jgi:N-acetylmuramoyl-L-alanine amidase
MWSVILFYSWFCVVPDAVVNPSANEPVYLEVEAQRGEGAYALLRRYELVQYSCNLAEFYTLNGLQQGARLLVGRSYKLPIRQYTYNGKSIRSTIGIDDWDTAILIQNYNDRMQELGRRPGDFRKDKILWVPYHLLNCPESDRPGLAASDEEAPDPDEAGEISFTEIATTGTTSGHREFTIFGSNYAKVPLQSQRLAGQVFYDVAGHGGPDPGAMTRRAGNALCEDEYAYDVALRLCRNLLAHGAVAYVINRDPNDGIRDDQYLDCDTDEVLWGNIQMYRNQKARLTQRSNVINALYDRNKSNGVTQQTTIVLHVDSRAKRERTDIFFYYQDGNAQGRRLANRLHGSMKQHYAKYQAGRGYEGTVSTRDLHMLRECKPTTVYIELANIRNPSDQQRILIPRNRQWVADWLLRGLL